MDEVAGNSEVRRVPDLMSGFVLWPEGTYGGRHRPSPFLAVDSLLSRT